MKILANILATPRKRIGAFVVGGRDHNHHDTHHNVFEIIPIFVYLHGLRML